MYTKKIIRTRILRHENKAFPLTNFITTMKTLDIYENMFYNASRLKYRN